MYDSISFYYIAFAVMDILTIPHESTMLLILILSLVYFFTCFFFFFNGIGSLNRDLFTRIIKFQNFHKSPQSRMFQSR